MKELGRDELLDIVHGSALMGTGGGGEISMGIKYIDAALDAGKTFRLVAAEDLSDSTMLCTPYALGATQASEMSEEHKRLPHTSQPPIINAIKKLAQHLNTEFGATVACEIGGENVAVAAYAAAMMDGALLDADAAGRAVPEITHSTYCLAGLNPAPLVMANEFGETLLCENIYDDQRAEDIARSFAIVSRNDIVAVDHAATVNDLRHALYHGSITLALKLGRAMRAQRALGEIDTKALAEIAGGAVLFQGRVSACSHNIEQGFTLGSIEIAGSGGHEGDTCRVEFKNENMLAYVNGALRVTIPDMICVVNDADIEALTNPNASVGMNVSVLVLPAPGHFTSAKGLSVFGPAYLGLSEQYTPFI